MVEALFGLSCTQVVEYYADWQTWVILAAKEQTSYVEEVMSHLFSETDQAAFPGYGQTRIYSKSDLSTAFHFWVRIENPDEVNFDLDALVEIINQTKPAHTRAVIHIVE